MIFQLHIIVVINEQNLNSGFCLFMRKNIKMEGLCVELVIIIRIAAEKLIEIITRKH